MAMIVTMAELNQQTADVVDRIVESGQPAMLTRHGRFVMVLTPVSEEEIASRYLADALPLGGLPAQARRGRKPRADVEPPERKRATRLPDDWQPSRQLVAWALGRGMPADWQREKTLTFCNYWHAKAGQAATKHDWDATWQNWLIREAKQDPPRPQINGTPIGAATEKGAGWVKMGKEMDERRGAWATASPDFGVRRPVLEAGPGDAGGME